MGHRSSARVRAGTLPCLESALGVIFLPSPPARVIGGPMPGALVQFSVASLVRTQLPTLRQGFGFAQCQGLPFAFAVWSVRQFVCPVAKRMGRPRPSLAIKVSQLDWSPISTFRGIRGIALR